MVQAALTLFSGTPKVKAGSETVSAPRVERYGCRKMQEETAHPQASGEVLILNF